MRKLENTGEGGGRRVEERVEGGPCEGSGADDVEENRCREATGKPPRPVMLLGGAACSVRSHCQPHKIDKSKSPAVSTPGTNTPCLGSLLLHIASAVPSA